MPVRYFALILGVVFLLVGVLGFVPGINQTHHALHPDVSVQGPGTGLLLGLFPVNVLHNLVHILFGIWGIAAYRTLPASRLYARGVAIIYGVLTIMGLVPALNTTFGLIPIYGNDVWLHGLIALVAAIFGWAPVERLDVRRDVPPHTGAHGV
jgi:Domain of unknown function (DUF4383)